LDLSTKKKAVKKKNRAVLYQPMKHELDHTQ